MISVISYIIWYHITQSLKQLLTIKKKKEIQNTQIGSSDFFTLQLFLLYCLLHWLLMIDNTSTAPWTSHFTRCGSQNTAELPSGAFPGTGDFLLPCSLTENSSHLTPPWLHSYQTPRVTRWWWHISVKEEQPLTLFLNFFFQPGQTGSENMAH